MIKKKTTYFMIIAISFLLVSWSIYSYFFSQRYDEVKTFATEGAQPIIKILEILNYRTEELTPYFIIFFSLISLSFLLLIYVYLFTSKYQLSPFYSLFLSALIFIFIVKNIWNTLFLFFLILLSVSLLIMVSISLTVKYLYADNDVYEEGDVLQTDGPFNMELEAIEYQNTVITLLNKKNKNQELYINSAIYLEDDNQYYVDFYFEKKSKKDDKKNE